MGFFDTTVVKESKTSYVPYEKEVTIHEHRAPTDKSLELLNEMNKKSIANLVKSVEIDSNELKCCAVYLRDEVFSNRVNYVIRFILNGKEHIIESYLSGDELMQNRMGFNYNGHMIRKTYEEMSKLISIKLLEEKKDFVNFLK